LQAARTVIGIYLDAKLREAKWVWGAIEGDFNKDPDLGQIVLGTVISLIPILDQISDFRDLSANLIALCEADDLRDFWLLFAVVITLIGCFPEIGSAIKGVFQAALKVLKDAGHIPLRRLVAMLNSVGEGHVVRWLRELSSDLRGKYIPWLVEHLR